MRSAQRRPRPVLTGRALGLGALVVLLVVVLASPVHRYLASRSDVTAARQQLTDDSAALRDLRALDQRYGDPGYIQQLARDRLQYAMPGDTVYVVVDHGARNGIDRTRTTAVAGTVTGRTWNERLMNSIRTAGR